MSGAFQLLTSDLNDTLGRFCAVKGVNIFDMWLPLRLLRSPRAGDDIPVMISPSTAVALVDHTTGKLTTRRSEILGLVPVLFADERKFAIPPSTVPTGCTIFARATEGMAAKRIPSGTVLMHRAVTPAQAMSEGSCLVEVQPQPRAKKKTTSDSASADGGAQSVPVTSGDSVNQVRKRARSDAAFDELLQKALGSLRRGRGVLREGVIIKETLDNLLQIRNAPPLHFVTHNKRVSSLNVQGCVWNLPDERIIYRVFRGREEGSGPSTSTHTDVARFIVVFLIDGVLLKRKTGNVNMDPDGTTWSLMDEELPAVADALAERGYRTVLLDHYPSLHHGNQYALETTLTPIAELCRRHFTKDVTVVLSAVSNISASFRRDSAPFIFPHSGLWEFFITQLNGGMRAGKDSVLVGSTASIEQHKDTWHWGQRGRQFAVNCGLRHVDGATLKREVLHGEGA